MRDGSNFQEILQEIVKFTDNMWEEEPGDWHEVGVNRLMAENLAVNAIKLLEMFMEPDEVKSFVEKQLG